MNRRLSVPAIVDKGGVAAAARRYCCLSSSTGLRRHSLAVEASASTEVIML